MSKKKHKQNQSLISDETKNKVVSDSQQNELQPDATNPQEHGRSMTEMLGVLAVLGVLSIGGVQGYRYAMNKYHSNKVINELNLLNAQLAVFMNGIHDDEAVMSLGEPYDNGETINAGGYAFSYGCGQDPDSMTPCDLDETGYYMTLDGVPEDVCKSASQMTANMMNLVEQRINGHTDNKGILCQDGDNQLVFLFDANEGQGFENGEGEEGDNGDVTDAHYPDTTYQYEEETTPLHTGTETETYSVGGECQTNNACGNGYYCDIDNSTLKNCWNDFTLNQDAVGTCRKANPDLQNKPSSAPFWISNRKMSWWSAVNFCQALGMRLASANDYGCSGTRCYDNPTLLNMMSAYGNNAYAWTSSDYSTGLKLVVPNFFGHGTDWMCGGGCTAQYYAACTDGSWVAPEVTEPTTTPQYATATYTQTATGTYTASDCEGFWGYKDVKRAKEYCSNRGGVVKLSEIGCTMTNKDSTGKACSALNSWLNAGVYVVGNFPPTYTEDIQYKHCEAPYLIQKWWTDSDDVWVGWGLYGTERPLCWDDYRRGNSAVTATYTETDFETTTTIFETTPYQTASYVVTNPTHSSIWLGPNEVYSRTAAREYCENNGGVLAKVADVGCTKIVSSSCNITVNLHPHDWTIFDDYEASWSNDSIYVDAQTSVTTQYGSYPVCVPK